MKNNYQNNAFIELYRNSDIPTQVAIWDELKQEILRGNTAAFSECIMPLLEPLISSYAYKLPSYGTYREDFRAEVMTDIYFSLGSYDPYYKGELITGTVYFKNRIKGVHTRFCRSLEKEKNIISNDTQDVLEIYISDNRDVCREVVESIARAEVLNKYYEMRERYTEYYARQKTREYVRQHNLH